MDTYEIVSLEIRHKWEVRVRPYEKKKWGIRETNRKQILKAKPWLEKKTKWQIGKHGKQNVIILSRALRYQGKNMLILFQKMT